MYSRCAFSSCVRCAQVAPVAWRDPLRALSLSCCLALRRRAHLGACATSIPRSVSDLLVGIRPPRESCLPSQQSLASVLAVTSLSQPIDCTSSFLVPTSGGSSRGVPRRWIHRPISFPGISLAETSGRSLFWGGRIREVRTVVHIGQVVRPCELAPDPAKFLSRNGQVAEASLIGGVVAG